MRASLNQRTVARLERSTEATGRGSGPVDPGPTAHPRTSPERAAVSENSNATAEVASAAARRRRQDGGLQPTRNRRQPRQSSPVTASR